MTMNTARAVLAAMTLCCATAAAAQPPPEPLRLVREQAARGDAAAQYRLAARYDSGDGVAKNPAEAVRWYGQAAAQGHVGAQLTLAQRYDDGNGVAKDPAKALQWYRRAATNGAMRPGGGGPRGVAPGAHGGRDAGAMTYDDWLIRYLDGKFEEIDRRFEQVDKRFEQVDKRFEQVDKRFEQVDGQLAAVHVRIDDMAREQRVQGERLAALEVWVYVMASIGGALLLSFALAGVNLLVPRLFLAGRLREQPSGGATPPA